MVAVAEASFSAASTCKCVFVCAREHPNVDHRLGFTSLLCLCVEVCVCLCMCLCAGACACVRCVCACLCVYCCSFQEKIAALIPCLNITATDPIRCCANSDFISRCSGLSILGLIRT
jgi:hypothetical protein